MLHTRALRSNPIRALIGESPCEAGLSGICDGLPAMPVRSDDAWAWYQLVPVPQDIHTSIHPVKRYNDERFPLSVEQQWGFRGRVHLIRSEVSDISARSQTASHLFREYDTHGQSRSTYLVTERVMDRDSIRLRPLPRARSPYRLIPLVVANVSDQPGLDVTPPKGSNHPETTRETV